MKTAETVDEEELAKYRQTKADDVARNRAHNALMWRLKKYAAHSKNRCPRLWNLDMENTPYTDKPTSQRAWTVREILESEG